MKQRNIMAVILLSIVTAGIYDIYWLVQTKKVLNQQTDVRIPTLWLLFAPVLLVVVVLGAVGLVTMGGSDSGSTVGVATGLNIVGFLGVVAVIPTTFYWFFQFSKAISRYTRGEMSTAVTFLLLYMLRFIGMALVQDHFNDMIAGGQMAMQHSGTMPNANVPMPGGAPNFGQPAPAMPQPFGPMQAQGANGLAADPNTPQPPTNQPQPPIQ